MWKSLKVRNWQSDEYESKMSDTFDAKVGIYMSKFRKNSGNVCFTNVVI